VRVLAISGSLRPASLNSLLLRAAEEQAPAGLEFDHYLGLAAIPPFHGERDGSPVPAEVTEFLARIASADAVLIATPEYNGSIPGVLKNALDWASTPFPENVLKGKPVAVIGASTGGYGAMWAQADLRKVLGLIGARAVDPQIPVAKAHDLFGEDGRLLDDNVRLRLEGLLEALAQEIIPAVAA
jgi:chromate reductase